MALFRNGIIGIILILIALVFGLTPIQDFDLWWHLRLGELLTRNLSSLWWDTLSYTAYGETYQNHSWLASLLLYRIHLLAGLDGLSVFVVLITLGITAVFYKTVADDKHWGLSLLVTFLVLWSLSDRIATRPHLWSLFFSILYFTILFHPLRDRRNFVWSLILLQIFWANLHGEFFFGIILVWLVFIGSYWGEGFKKLAIPAVGVLLASLISPYTYKTLLYPIAHSGFYFITHYTAEWLSPFSPVFRNTLSFKFFQGTLVLLILSFIVGLRQFSLSRFLVGAFITFMACRSRRFLPHFMLLGVPLILANCRFFFNRWRFGPPLVPRVIHWGSIALILLIALNFYMHGVKKILGPGGRTFVGGGILPNVAPREVLDFLETHKITGRIFNDPALGGYLLYHRPHEKIFIDGRTPLYGDHFYGRTVSAFLFPPGEFERLEKEYQFDYVVMPTDDAWLKADFHAYLWGRPDWVLVYYSLEGAVYLKDLPKFQKVIEKHRLLTSPILEEMKKEGRPPRLFHESDIPGDFRSQIPGPASGISHLGSYLGWSLIITSSGAT